MLQKRIMSLIIFVFGLTLSLTSFGYGQNTVPKDLIGTWYFESNSECYITLY